MIDGIIFRDQSRVIPLADSHGGPVTVSHQKLLSPPSLHDIDTSGQSRLQRFSVFLDHYLPRHDSQDTIPAYAFVKDLPGRLCELATLPSALDVCCYAQIGHDSHDEKLLGTALSRYGDALTDVKLALTRKDRDKVLAIVPSMILLAQAELFSVISLKNGWYSHIAAATHLLSICGPQSITDPFSYSMFRSARQSAICRGLIVRRALPFTTPEWLELTHDEAEWNPATALTDILVHVPGALQEFDRSMQQEPAIEVTMRAARRQLLKMHNDLQQWYDNLHSNSPDHYWRIPATDLSAFQDEHARYQRECFDFTSYSAALMLTLYWSVRLVIVRDLLKLAPGARGAHLAPVVDAKAMLETTNESVQSLVASVPFLLGPETGTPGRIAILVPLYIVEQHFVAVGDHKGLEWCNAVRLELGRYGITSPDRDRRRLLPS